MAVCWPIGAAPPSRWPTLWPDSLTPGWPPTPIRSSSSANCWPKSKPTGRFSRTYPRTGPRPSPGPSNLHLVAGAKSADALIAEIADGFYVTDLIGVGVNLVTGDYSRGASGFWIENGQLTFPVSEVTIAGHLTEIFKSLTPANDLVFRYGTNAPTVRVEGLTVAGH